MGLINKLKSIRSIFSVDDDYKYRCSCKSYRSYKFMEDLGTGMDPVIFEGLDHYEDPTNCIKKAEKEEEVDEERNYAILKITYKYSVYKCVDCGDKFKWDVKKKDEEWVEK